MTRDEMISRVNNLRLYEKDYDTLLKLMNNADDKFFVKVLEEILNGTLYIQDFERLFEDTKYEEALYQNFENQRRIKTEITRLIDYRKNILNEVYDVEISTTKLGLLRPLDTSSYKDLYNTVDEEVREDLIYQILSVKPNDQAIVRDAKVKFLTAYENGEITHDDILLFAEDHIIPIDYRYQTLNDADNEFMYENKLTEDEMKKIKTLSLFLRRNKVGE
jgi:hypothetical protein